MCGDPTLDLLFTLIIPSAMVGGIGLFAFTLFNKRKNGSKELEELV
jgi:hypothetical protein